MLVSGSEAMVWDKDDLRAVLKADHGYSAASPQIEYLAQVMSEFDEKQQRLFLSFITGSPRLPVGGFKELRPR
jgi:E3 ubiquitin-protein ligase TRIP12